MVKTFALQGLADLGRQDARLRELARRTIEESFSNGHGGYEVASAEIIERAAELKAVRESQMD